LANITGVDPPVLNDEDYVDKIENSLNAIDAHDHTSGKGKTIGESAQTVVLANASKFVVRDVTGAVVSNTKAVPTGTVVGTTDTQVLSGKTISGASNTLTVRAASDITGQLPIANGGTGAATKAAGFDALSPMSASGDLVYGGAAGTGTRLAKGSDTQVLTLSSGLPVWATPATAPDQSYEVSNLSIACSVASSALTISLKDKSGADPSVGSPVKIGFRRPMNAATATMTIASPCVVTVTGHTFVANDPFIFTTTGALPTGLTVGTVYYVLAPSGNTFNVAATSGGSAINTSGSQSGTHTAAPVGAYNQRSAMAATSLVVASTATLGTQSAVQAYLYVYALDNAGTVELAISQSLFNDGTVQSSTTMSGSATSPSTIYSTSGRTSVPVRLIGRLSSTQATAGTWATAPAEIALVTSAEVDRIRGTVTSDNAVAGMVGEYVSAAQAQTNTSTTNAWSDITSISLTPGDWDVSGTVEYNLNTGTSVTNPRIGISTTSGNSSTGLTQGSTYIEFQPPTAGSNSSMSIPAIRMSLSATTTVYLKGLVTFSGGQPRYSGAIHARRVR
jgi:hypothetical protein